MRTALSKTGPHALLAKRLLQGVMIGFCGLALIGCKQHHGRYGGHVIADYSEMHPIEVSKRSAAIKIRAIRGAYGMSNRQTKRVARFLHRYKKTGKGQLIITAPSGASNEIAAMNVLKDIRTLVRDFGIAPSAINYRPYYAGNSKQPPVRMAFRRYVATAPECGNWSQDLGDDEKNLPYPNFGCSTQRNLALMVANPRDLVKPRSETPRSSPRRDVTWDKYVKGESTVSKKSKEESGTVSDVAKN